MAKLLDTNSLSGVFHEIKQAIAGAFDNLTDEQKLEIKGDTGATGATGPQGIPGESAVFDPTTGNIAVIEQTTGDSITNPMSQKAVTGELQKADRKIDYGDIASETSILTSANSWTNKRYFNSSGQSKTSSGWKACADIYVSEYDFVRVSLCDASSAACIIFLDANNQCIVDASIPGAGTSQAPYYREIVVKVPASAVRLGISALIDEQTYGTPYCYGLKMNGGIVKANETREILDDIRLGEVQVVKAPGWLNGWIGVDGQGHADDGYWLTLPMLASKIYSFKSIASTPTDLILHYYNADFNHLGQVNGGKEVTSIVKDAHYVRLWFADDGTSPDNQLEIKQYVGGLGRCARLNGKSVVTFGDSATWYDLHKYLNGDEEGVLCKGYQTYMREEGMMVDNQGQSGYTMPRVYNEEVLPYTRFGVVDYVTIMDAGNDSKNGVPVGEIAEIGSTFDTTTFYGALQAIIEHILGINPRVKIVLLTTTRGWVYQAGSPPKTKREYIEAIKDVAKLYGYAYIDIFDSIGLNELTRDVMMNDPEPTGSGDTYSLHLSNFGYKRFAEIMLPRLADL